MIAQPADLERRALRCRASSQREREGLVALQSRKRNEAVEHVGEKESHPDAGADAPPPEHVDAVVPVAGAAAAAGRSAPRWRSVNSIARRACS